MPISYGLFGGFLTRDDEAIADATFEKIVGAITAGNASELTSLFSENIQDEVSTLEQDAAE